MMGEGSRASQGRPIAFTRCPQSQCADSAVASEATNLQRAKCTSKVPPSGAALWRWMLLPRGTMIVVVVAVRCVPVPATRQMRASEMAFAPRSRTPLRCSGPLKLLHRPLQAARGWQRREHERSIAKLAPQWRQRACARRRRRRKNYYSGGVVFF